MSRIAVLGVNGRVGAELALSLHKAGCEVTGLLRAEYGAALCKLTGMPYRIVDGTTDLREFDTVIDAAIPAGDSAALRRQIQQLIDRWLNLMRPNATYVYLSSIMALGIPSGRARACFYRVPRTSYGYAKRRAERFAARLGQARNVRVVALRLGQVHGHFQAASQDFIDKLSRRTVAVNGRPDDLTTTVFVSELAEFFASGAESALPTGTYHAVSNPQWRQEDLFGYFRRRHGCMAAVSYDTPLAAQGTVDAIRQLAESYLLGELPALTLPLKGWYRKRHAATPRHVHEGSSLVNLLGPCPQPRLPLCLTAMDVERREAAFADFVDSTLAVSVA